MRDNLSHFPFMARSRTSNSHKDSSASLGFETKLWLAADKLRNNMEAAEYKHGDSISPMISGLCRPPS